MVNTKMDEKKAVLDRMRREYLDERIHGLQLARQCVEKRIQKCRSMKLGGHGMDHCCQNDSGSIPSSSTQLTTKTTKTKTDNNNTKLQMSVNLLRIK